MVLAISSFWEAATFRFELSGRRYRLLQAWQENPTPETERAWQNALAEKRRNENAVRIELACVGTGILLPSLWLLLRKTRPVESPVPRSGSSDGS